MDILTLIYAPTAVILYSACGANNR